MFCGFVYFPWYLTNLSLRGRGHWTLVCVYSFNESDSEVIIITKKRLAGLPIIPIIDLDLDHPARNAAVAILINAAISLLCPAWTRERWAMFTFPRIHFNYLANLQPPDPRFHLVKNFLYPFGWVIALIVRLCIWLKMKRSEISLPWKANEGVQGQDRSSEFISEANLIVVVNVKHCKVIHVSKKHQHNLTTPLRPLGRWQSRLRNQLVMVIIVFCYRPLQFEGELEMVEDWESGKEWGRWGKESKPRGRETNRVFALTCLGCSWAWLLIIMMMTTVLTRIMTMV